MCSETSEAVGTTWEHAQLEFQNFLKIRITLNSDNCKIRQLSVGTAVSGPTVSGNCKCFPGTETTVRSYSFRADNCKILQF